MTTVLPRSYHFQMSYAHLFIPNIFGRWYDCTGNTSESKYPNGLNSYAFLRLPKHLPRMKHSIKSSQEFSANQIWLTVAQVCEFLTISKSTFYKWRMLGIAPVAKRLPNGDLRIRQDWLNEFMAELPEEQ